ncbi:hypothetical protein EYZ11_004714 [Aspergillus tanneri]|uniref:Uncharacterized protein n=1 Tax=Aspergillus tanneri TaxID=1220188 RepID=A0A4V3UPN0_9EURO|nr:hypothetical protein EYZ11_004714 [Aspergillus tanneri]
MSGKTYLITGANRSREGHPGLGVDHIDAVISSAGIAKLNTIEDLPLEELEEMLRVNAFSVMLL